MENQDFNVKNNKILLTCRILLFYFVTYEQKLQPKLKQSTKIYKWE